MTISYKIRLLDQLGELDMLDVNPDFIETEDTCYKSDYYFEWFNSIEEAETAIETVIKDYPNTGNQYTIIKVYD